LKKILSVVLKIKYDVENLTHNQNRMNNILNDVILKNDRSVLSLGDSVTTINDDNDYSLMLPLHNEDELSDFENKLLNKSFRLNVVSYSYIDIYLNHIRTCKLHYVYILYLWLNNFKYLNIDFRLMV